MGISSDWERLAIVDVAPPDAASAKINLSTRSVVENGSDRPVWFDEIRISQPNLVNNPGLERGVSFPDGFDYWGDNSVYTTWENTALHGERSVRLDVQKNKATGGIKTIIDNIYGRVPYQFSANMRTKALYGNLILGITWLDGDGNELNTYEEVFALNDYTDWTELTIADESHSSAESAILRVGVTNASHGIVFIDDLDMRIDGPYVAPWITLGWHTYEVDSREVLEQIVEAAIGGAQMLIGHPSVGYQARDLLKVAQAATMLAPYDDIIVDGRPVMRADLFSDGTGLTSAWGMERDGDALIMGSSYNRLTINGTPMSFNVYYRTKFTGTLSKIFEDGTTEPVEITPYESGYFSFSVEFDPNLIKDKDKARVALYIFERDRECFVPEGLNTRVTPKGVFLSWKPLDCANTYNIRYRKPDYRWVILPNEFEETKINLSDFANLEPNSYYEWQVRSVCTDSISKGYVKIILYKNRRRIGLIAKNINPASGSYPWRVGNYIGGTAQAGSGYKIRIRKQGSGSKVFDDSDSSFNLIDIPQITVTSPNGDEELPFGSTGT